MYARQNIHNYVVYQNDVNIVLYLEKVYLTYSLVRCDMLNNHVRNCMMH